jgi:hypothetical protein
MLYSFNTLPPHSKDAMIAIRNIYYDERDKWHNYFDQLHILKVSASPLNIATWYNSSSSQTLKEEWLNTKEPAESFLKVFEICGLLTNEIKAELIPGFTLKPSKLYKICKKCKKTSIITRGLKMCGRCYLKHAGIKVPKVRYGTVEYPIDLICPKCNKISDILYTNGDVTCYRCDARFRIVAEIGKVYRDARGKYKNTGIDTWKTVG